MLNTHEDSKMAYDFDPIGVLPGNKITNELHTITAVNGVEYNYIIPNAAPFFSESMVVVDAESGIPVNEGSGYFYAYPFEEATVEIGKPIYGAIAFTDVAAAGSYRLVYRTIGGDYVNASTIALFDGLDTLGALANTPWASLSDIPADFPPTPHNLPLTNITGVPQILSMLEELSIAVRSPERAIAMADIVDLDTALVSPIVESMKSVAASIESMAAATSFYHTGGSTGTVLKELPTLVAGVWTDVNVTVLVKHSGNYLVFTSGNPRIRNAGVRVTYEFRYLINGYPVGASTLATSPVGLTEGAIVTLQIRTPDVSASEVVVADVNVSCSLTLLKVGS